MDQRCGAIARPIVQIHPTRHCNLQCRHCYSSSGPRVRQALEPDVIRRFLAEAHDEGFGIASFSGGEPLIYPDIFRCLEAAAELGYGTMLATNGMLIDRATADRLARTVALIAVSIDGPPDMHNALRGSPAAFAGAVRGLALLREAGANFAIIHTLTGASLPHLRWLVAFAREQGAGLLQLHPLELAGYAGRHMRASAVDGEVATRAWLLATLLADEHEAPKIHVDVFDRELIAAHPEMVFADDMEDAADAPLSRLVNPLVLEPNGDVVPLAYGFGRSFRVCNMRQDGLRAAVPAFRAATWPRLRALCRREYRDVLAEDELPYFNWYERITRTSCEVGEAATA